VDSGFKGTTDVSGQDFERCFVAEALSRSMIDVFDGPGKLVVGEEFHADAFSLQSRCTSI
jgi:hypothetical protein